MNGNIDKYLREETTSWIQFCEILKESRRLIKTFLNFITDILKYSLSVFVAMISLQIERSTSILIFNDSFEPLDLF